MKSILHLNIKMIMKQHTAACSSGLFVYLYIYSDMFGDSTFLPVCAHVIAFLKSWLVKIVSQVTKVFSLELKNIVSLIFVSM